MQTTAWSKAKHSNSNHSWRLTMTCVCASKPQWITYCVLSLTTRRNESSLIYWISPNNYFVSTAKFHFWLFAFVFSLFHCVCAMAPFGCFFHLTKLKGLANYCSRGLTTCLCLPHWWSLCCLKCATTLSGPMMTCAHTFPLDFACFWTEATFLSGLNWLPWCCCTSPSILYTPSSFAFLWSPWFSSQRLSHVPSCNRHCWSPVLDKEHLVSGLHYFPPRVTDLCPSRSFTVPCCSAS